MEIFLKNCKKIDYADVLELGFEREELNDSVHFQEYGWHDFIMSKEVADNVVFYWHTTEHKAYMARTNKDKGDIYNYFAIRDYQQLCMLLSFFEDKQTSKFLEKSFYEDEEETTHFPMYC